MNNQINPYDYKQLEELGRRCLEWKKQMLCFEIFVCNSSLREEDVLSWFRKMTRFQPKTMSGTHITNCNTLRYKENRFFSGISKEIEAPPSVSFWLRPESLPGMPLRECVVKRSHYISIIRTQMLYDDFLDDQETILADFEEFFRVFNGCIGYVYNHYDQYIVQNPQNVNVYKDAGIPLDGLRIIPSSTPEYRPDSIDIEDLPGHTHRLNLLSFTSCCWMWFGSDYYQFISRDKVESFSNCAENRDIGGIRRIKLCEDIMDYNAPLYRERQWAFRKHVKLDDIVSISEFPFPIYGATPPDPDIDFRTGNFEHGGTLLAIHYINKRGKPVSKSKAYAAITREMRGNDIVWQQQEKLKDD